MIPTNIQRTHVVLAANDFDAPVAHAFHESTRYDVLVNGKRYPPKAIVGLAARHATGAVLEPKDFTGGVGSTCFRVLESLGFEVVPKIESRSAFVFRVGQRYTRQDVYSVVGVPLEQQGGDWDTGYHRHNGSWFVFCGVGAAGRTGHDYENHFDGPELVWRGKTKSRLAHPSIQSLVSGEAEVHLFFRFSDREPFEYAGMARAVEVLDDVPVRVRWRFDDPALSSDSEAGGETGTDFLFYWKPQTVAFQLGDLLDHAAGQQLRQVSSGDILWIVTARDGELFLVGRIVVDRILDQVSAEQALQRNNLWESDFHVLPKRGTEVPVTEIPLGTAAYELRFQSKADRLAPEGLGQQLQSLRKLTPQSARLLETFLKVSTSPTAASISSRGAGFGAAHENVIVERGAVDAAVAHYTRQGWEIESVEKDRCGFDLICRKGASLKRVEVKGIRGKELSFPITRREVEAAKDEVWELCAVTDALVDPTVHTFTNVEFKTVFDLQVISYMARLR